MYHNVLSHGNIYYNDEATQSQIDIEVAGSLYSEGSLELVQSSNDGFRFVQDPSNLNIIGLSDDTVNVIHYQE